MPGCVGPFLNTHNFNGMMPVGRARAVYVWRVRFRRSSLAFANFSGRSRIEGAGNARPSILDDYVRETAWPLAAAADIFRGESSHRAPARGRRSRLVRSGSTPTHGLTFFIERSGGVGNGLAPSSSSNQWKPATPTCSRLPGASVTAIESNSGAFLKCLIVKEIVPLTRVAGSCSAISCVPQDQTRTRPHLLVASGVLYHAADPVRLLQAMAHVSDNVGCGRTTLDPATMHKEELERLFDPPVEQVVGERGSALHRRHLSRGIAVRRLLRRGRAVAIWMELAT